MKLVITIDTDGAAFEDNQDEITDILTDYANRVRNGYSFNRILRDSNGNAVGHAETVEEPAAVTA